MFTVLTRKFDWYRYDHALLSLPQQFHSVEDARYAARKHHIAWCFYIVLNSAGQPVANF